ncbi:MAG TPA: palindromic element RPE4 domain-containing protein, partial [Rickettsia endosymbiont of Pyrocoelia pectoralis]|nr:palindromic element RPE4 domain-containing protein [Rickettsia endosymbiont of Pyrocoelia pectoralis]
AMQQHRFIHGMTGVQMSHATTPIYSRDPVKHIKNLVLYMFILLNIFFLDPVDKPRDDIES